VYSVRQIRNAKVGVSLIRKTVLQDAATRGTCYWTAHADALVRRSLNLAKSNYPLLNTSNCVDGAIGLKAVELTRWTSYPRLFHDR